MSIEDRRKAFLGGSYSEQLSRSRKAQIKTILVSFPIFLAAYFGKQNFVIGLCFVTLWYILFRLTFYRYDYYWAFPSSWPITNRIKGVRSSTFLVVPAVPFAMGSALSEKAVLIALSAFIFAASCYMFKSIVMEYRTENS